MGKFIRNNSNYDTYKSTNIVFCSEEFKELKFINESSYPEIIDPTIIHELKVKAWFVLRTFRLLSDELVNRSYIENRLSPYKSDLFKAINKHPEKGPYIIYFINLRIGLTTEILFFEIKSFLDFLAVEVIAKALNIKTTLQTFKKREDDPGGKFIEVLQKNAPDESKRKAAKIISILKKHKELWLDYVINNRDKITHYGTLQTKITIKTLPLQGHVTNFRFDTYFDNKNLSKYSRALLYNFLTFIKEVYKVITKE